MRPTGTMLKLVALSSKVQSMNTPTLRKWHGALVALFCMATGCASHSVPMRTTQKAPPLQATQSLQAVSAAQVPAPLRNDANISSRLETTFSIPNLKSDPFDYQKTDVRVQFRRDDGPIRTIPAFFDGGTTWRARHMPMVEGHYVVEAITLNNRVLDVRARPHQWNVERVKNRGFVRIDPEDKTRFVYDSGRPYFPLGHNQAWRNSDLPDIPQLFDKMGANGENWSRVWMNHWDGKNLDWPRPKGDFGTLNLDVARRWDSIVGAAERNNIAFQMTLQHHGQYSTQVNSNWDDNPYNVKNGGFLNKPEEFFTNAQAKDLTRRKLRYIVARWGYSPSIMAWELFNEVQFTDAARNNQWDSVAQWHREMAQFLRAQDSYHHLITTSSMESIPANVAAAMDYEQDHVYAPDLIVALAGEARTNAKPTFVGEFGPTDLKDSQGIYLHEGLWSSLMSGHNAAQYWFWDLVEQHNFYPQFRAASAFLAASDYARQINMRRVVPQIASGQNSDLAFSPGGGWATAKQSDFTLSSGQLPPGMSQLPSFLQGTNHRDMNPQPLSFRVNFARAGRFIVTLSQIAKAGAHVKLSMDGTAVEQDFAASDADYAPAAKQAQLTVDVPLGAHTITLENSGVDWVTIHRIALTNYAPSLAGFALENTRFAVAWIYHRANINVDFGQETGPASGTLTLPVLDVGRYRAAWWDTVAGKEIRSDDIVIWKGATNFDVAIPPIARDMAFFVRRVPAAK
jgi:hypothetical protein